MSKLGESCMNKKSKKAHAYEEREKSACEWRQRIVRPCTILCPRFALRQTRVTRACHCMTELRIFLFVFMWYN